MGVDIGQDDKEGSFVEFRPGTALREQVDAAFVAAGVRRTSSFEVGQIADMVQYAANGLGAAIVPRVFTGQRPDDVDPVRPFHVLGLTGSALNLTIRGIQKGRARFAIDWCLPCHAGHRTTQRLAVGRWVNSSLQQQHRTQLPRARRDRHHRRDPGHAAYWPLWESLFSGV